MRAILTTFNTRVGGSIARHRKYRPQVQRARSAVLRVFLPFNDGRGRCGRYLDGLYGYISVMQANGVCCYITWRG